jgi:hypothetical protein
MVNDGYRYNVVCTHCGAKPFSEGPHHDVTCERHQSALAVESDLAQSKRCRYCGARPFLAGPHHVSDCRRFFEVESADTPPSGVGNGEAAPTESGQISPDDVLEVFKSAEIPLLTAEEVAGKLDCPRAVADNHLDRLVERDDLYNKRLSVESEVFLLIEMDSESA